MKRLFALALAASGVGSCSVYMEATRPDPINLEEFKVGMERSAVIKKLGPPLISTKKDENSCDLYQLYTKGPGSGGKAALAFGEGVVDVFTLGLAEVVLTPTEIMTKNGKYPVTICYGTNDQVVSVEEAEKPVS